MKHIIFSFIMEKETLCPGISKMCTKLVRLNLLGQISGEIIAYTLLLQRTNKLSENIQYYSKLSIFHVHRSKPKKGAMAAEVQP